MTGWQRGFTTVAGLIAGAVVVLGATGVIPRGAPRIIAAELLVVAVVVQVMIWFAPPPFGARVVGIQDLGPDLRERVGAAISGRSRHRP